MVSKGFALLLAPVLAGCVMTVEHVLPPMPALDEQLLGTWRDSSGNRATVTRDRTGDFRIWYRDRNDPEVLAQFLGRSGRLGALPLLEVWPDPDIADDGEGDYSGMMAPGILQFPYRFDSLGVRLAALESDTIATAIRRRRLLLRRSEYDSPLILFGSPAQLRPALRPWLARARIAEADRWDRVPTEARDTTPFWAGTGGGSAASVDSLRTVVNLVLQAINTRDSALLRRLTLPSTTVLSMRGLYDSAVLRSRSREEFIEAVGGAERRVLERIWQPVYDRSDALAVVRAPYDFWVDGRFSHCGIDRFTLVRAAGEWKLAQLSYNVRTRDCQPSPLGPPQPS